MGLAERLFPKQFAQAREQVAAEVTRQAQDYINRNLTAPRSAFPGVFASWARSSGGKWPGGMSTELPGLVWNNWALRQQGRDIFEDSPEARTMVMRFADTVVDSGLVLEPEPDFGLLGITDPEKQQAWRDEVRASFHLWASSKRQHRSGMQTFYQVQRLAQIYMERDNDVFVRLYYDGGRDLQSPLQFEILDTNQIRGDAITSTLLTGHWNDGIVRNPDGTEATYQIWVQDQNSNQYRSVDVQRIGPSGKINMLHSFNPTYAGQSRGLSGLGLGAQEWENLQDFKLSNLMKAIAQSQLTLFNKPSKDAPASNPFEGFGQQSAGPPNISIGSPGNVPSAGVTGVVTAPNLNVTPVEEARFRTPGSLAVMNLDSGEEIVPFQNTAPVIGYGEFVDSIAAYNMAKDGMPLEAALMRFSNNYSASRGTLLLWWRIVCMKRDHLADDLLNPTYEMWLGAMIAAGKIACPGWSDPRLRAAWLGCRWNGTPMPNIDPNQTAKADQALIEMGAKTLDDVARETNGSSGRANRAALKVQLREMNEAGPPPWGSGGFGGVNAGNGPASGTTANGQPPADDAPQPKKGVPKK